MDGQAEAGDVVGGKHPVGANMVSETAQQRQFSLFAVLALMTLLAIEFSFLRLHGARALTFVALICGFSLAAFLTAHLGHRMIMWCGIAAGLCGGTAAATQDPLYPLFEFVTSSAMGVIIGCALGCVAELGALVILVPGGKISAQSIKQLDEGKLAGRRRAVAWCVAVGFLVTLSLTGALGEILLQ